MARRRRGRNEGGIYERSDGVWCASLSLGYDEQGKRRRKTVYGQTKAEVQEKLRQLLNGAADGRLCDAGRLTVSAYLARWLENTAKLKVRVGTWTRYEQLIRLRINPHIGGVQLAKLSPIHIEQLFANLERKGVSARGRQMAGTMLHTALAYAVHPLHLLPHNPASDVAKPKPIRPEIAVYDLDQVGRFLEAAKEDRLYALYVLAIDSGMREGELFALEWTDLDFTSRSVQVKRALKEVRGQIWVEDLKTGKSRRRINLSLATIDTLHDHRKQQLIAGTAGKLVFCDTEGNYLRRPNVARRSFFPIIERANAKATEEARKQGGEPVLLPRIKFHALRHTAATLLLLADERSKVVSERLGHSSTQVTDNCYSHVLPTMQERAAEKIMRS
jgi:integrase